MDEAFTGLTAYNRIVNNVVVYDSNLAQHIDRIRQFLQRCAERKITLNTTPDKWQFAQSLLGSPYQWRDTVLTSPSPMQSQIYPHLQTELTFMLSLA